MRYHKRRPPYEKEFLMDTSAGNQHQRDMLEKILNPPRRQLAYDMLPDNIPAFDTYDEKWDLSSWSLILSDNCIVNRLAHRNNMSMIKELDLSGAHRITDVGLIKLTNKMPHLKILSLKNASHITEIGLHHVVQRCSKLLNLNLDQCHGISGHCFAALGQHARGLLKLSLSGCMQITPWSFSVIFQGCKLLTELDLSFSSVTDKEIAVLLLGNSCCTNIKVLNLKGCIKISDSGILALSKGLSNLTTFTLSRNDMVTTNVTDVSLLAISDYCPGLKIVDLSGCQMLTDISLCWLAKGCKYLQQLNLANCSKVTNAGIRYLGEECVELQKIILKNVSKISDIGLSHIADGCPHLESLNVSGLYLLKDGADQTLNGFWSLAHGRCCLKIRHLNLHGCFQVSSFALTSISFMKNLESLVLSGCRSLTFDGIGMIAKECRAISHLSLAGCGKCVRDEMIETICLSLRELKILDLSDCVKIGENSLGSITLCHKLSSLKLSGCRNLSNDAILSLGDGKYDPGLEELCLNDCPKIDNTALTWILHSFRDYTASKNEEVVTLTTLSVKDTKITMKALKALESYFPYSSLEISSAYVGYIPLSRIKDRKCINEYAKMEKYATIIQALARGQQCRLLVLKMKNDRHINIMAVKIQRVWRGSSTRHRIKRLHRKQRDEFSSALPGPMNVEIFLKKNKQMKAIASSEVVKIQAICRGYLGHRFATKLKDKKHKHEELHEACCVRIQSICRMYLSKNTMLIKRHAAKVFREQQSRIKACRKIQLAWRTAMARQGQEKACIQIQLAWRTAIARRQCALNKMQVELYEMKMNQRREKASRLIARMLQSTLLRIIISKRIAKTRYLAKSVENIQGWYRKIVAERRKIEEQQALLQNAIIMAATILQAAARRLMAKSLKNRLQMKHHQLERLREAKAITIACWFRCILAKVKLQQLRSLRNQRNLEIIAATYIAAVWRGSLARKYARLKLESKKHLWVQIWNEDYQTHFYYNKLTGESRWSKPQQLLDFEPSRCLICSNCNFNDAEVECVSCEEYFCRICWETVHYGGKRRYHEYRLLCDNVHSGSEFKV